MSLSYYHELKKFTKLAKLSHTKKYFTFSIITVVVFLSNSAIKTRHELAGASCRWHLQNKLYPVDGATLYINKLITKKRPLPKMCQIFFLLIGVLSLHAHGKQRLIKIFKQQNIEYFFLQKMFRIRNINFTSLDHLRMFTTKLSLVGYLLRLVGGY